MENKNLKIGFIGQGWIGKNYADNFEQRGFNIVRYSREEEHKQNGNAIAECDIVFIAVPTPSTPQGFNHDILSEVIKIVGSGKVAVIKSTVLPGTTEIIQKENPEIFVLHSPEFLTESRAAYDAAHPLRNIVGTPVKNDEYQKCAQAVIDVLPKAPFELICKAEEAELIKYGGNCWFYFKVLYVNLLYDLAQKLGADYDVIKNAMAADPRIGPSHLYPLHKSGTLGGEAVASLKTNDYHLEPIHRTGRGAGGHCFIKDFAALTQIYKEKVGDEMGLNLLEAMKNKNIDLMLSTDKDLDLLQGVYGDDVINFKGRNKKLI
jgi:UDP-glucose 6-dehydrogenase